MMYKRPFICTMDDPQALGITKQIPLLSYNPFHQAPGELKPCAKLKGVFMM